MAEQQNFRSAFNGFNREDVVHYIEYLNSKHTAELNQLKSEVQFLRDKLNQEAPQADDGLLEQQAAEISDLTVQLQAATDDLDTLRGQKEELENQFREAAAAASETETLLQAAQAENAGLAAQLEEALAQQHSYESRVEEELAAYRRAERAERMARERAQQMYHQANGIIADATVKVEGAAAQIGQLSESVMEQLRQLQEAVAGSNSALKDAAAGMFAIRPEAEE